MASASLRQSAQQHGLLVLGVILAEYQSDKSVAGSDELGLGIAYCDVSILGLARSVDVLLKEEL
jgi:hypothetical protein